LNKVTNVWLLVFREASPTTELSEMTIFMQCPNLLQNIRNATRNGIWLAIHVIIYIAQLNFITTEKTVLRFCSIMLMCNIFNLYCWSEFIPPQAGRPTATLPTATWGDDQQQRGLSLGQSGLVLYDSSVDQRRILPTFFSNEKFYTRRRLVDD
jgi:hypothetical protein